MPLKLGSKSIKDVYFRDKKLSKIYFGNKLVYQKTNNTFIIKSYIFIERYLNDEYIPIETLENKYPDEYEEHLAVIRNNKIYIIIDDKETEFILTDSFNPQKLIEAPYGIGVKVYE